MAYRQLNKFLIPGSCFLILAAFFLWAELRYRQLERLSIELPKQFLELEHAIGFTGFIHNFKNYVLRPDEDKYWRQAVDNYRDAEIALGKINHIMRQLDMKKDISAFSRALTEFRVKLDVIKQAYASGKSMAEVDDEVRIPSVAAGVEISRFQDELKVMLDMHKSDISEVRVTATLIAFMAALYLFIGEYIRRRQAENHAMTVIEKDKFLVQAEHLAELGRWRTLPDGSVNLSQIAMKICGVTSPILSQALFYSDLVHPDDRDEVREQIESTLSNGGPLSCTHRLLRPDGKTVLVHQAAEVIRDRKTDQTGFVATIQDISDTVDTEKKLRHAQRMQVIGNLTGGLAHDFNNLLAVIIGNLELTEHERDKGNLSDYIDSAIKAARGGADLVKNMLSFAGQSKLEIQTIDLHEIVRDNIKWLTRLVPETIAVKTLLTAERSHIQADKGLAQNALLNLVLNARDAMPNGGTLVIETKNIEITDDSIETRDEVLDCGSYVVLSVKDTGIGISETDIDRIFDPFFTTKPSSGTGLGLSMVYGFMKQSGGGVTATSTSGVGTEITLYFKALPVQAVDPPPPPDPVREVRPDQNAHILFVEDDDMLRDVVKKILTQAGFRVDEARTGDAALERWRAFSGYDLVLTDVVMPGRMTGPALVRELRKERPGLPVILMSGYPGADIAQDDAIDARDPVLIKPVSRSRLLDAIEQVLELA